MMVNFSTFFGICSFIRASTEAYVEKRNKKLIGIDNRYQTSIRLINYFNFLSIYLM